MSRYFPVFVDITGRKAVIYGAGRIASRRVATLLAFAPLVTVFAPEASEMIQREASAGRLLWKRTSYEPGSVPPDACLVLAATDDPGVNREIWRECRRKGVPVNVCSDRTLCDFQFPGIAVREDLVIGINAGGADHRLARAWTERIRREVEEHGARDDHKAQTASDVGQIAEDGAGDPHG